MLRNFGIRLGGDGVVNTTGWCSARRFREPLAVTLEEVVVCFFRYRRQVSVWLECGGGGGVSVGEGCGVERISVMVANQT